MIGFFLDLAILILGNVSVTLNGQAYVFGTYETESVEKKTSAGPETKIFKSEFTEKSSE